MRSHWVGWIAGGTFSGWMTVGLASAALFFPEWGDAQRKASVLGDLLGSSLLGAVGGLVAGTICALVTHASRADPNGRRSYRVAAAGITACLAVLPATLFALLMTAPPPLGGGFTALQAAATFFVLVTPFTLAAWLTGGWIWRWTHPTAASASDSVKAPS